MARIETSISDRYLAGTLSNPGWGAWEGIRELVQNGKDSEVEFDAPLKVTHLGTTLRIENEGAALSREALLLGTSSKTERSDMIGKFGEGLKLGILALVRSGHAVKIRTGGEVWVASIERSERYDANVLCFDIKGGNEDKRRVRVEISGVTASDWDGLKGRFLFLTKPKAGTAVETDRGTLLLDEAARGQVFVKGIYVQTDTRLNAGYDFRHCDVDRDRKMISSWDLRYECGQIWTAAAATRPDLLEQFFMMMLDGKSDVEGLEHSASYASLAVKTDIAAQFTAKFGAGAVPVATLAESAEVEHLGKRGIVVSRPLGALLATTMGNKDELQKSMREEVTKTLSWGDLGEAQKYNLLDSVKLLGAVRADCTLDLVDIVEFRSANMMGQYKSGRLLIAARLLSDRDETLATLVHEFSHREGGDGEKNHVMAIENLWRDIVKSLRTGAAS
jgi:hypothetical protein